MKRDILSTLLLLMGVSVFAQPGITEPVFDETKDAKLIFIQDFESDWDTWTTTPVNTITQVEYYNNEGTHNSNSLKPWENPEQWQRGLFRDTTIALYNGVVITGSPEYETWTETPEKNSTIIHDSGSEKTDRMSAMAAFGEPDRGGDSYFKFVTDSAPIRYGVSSYSTSTGLSARYVRNLNIHGLSIEENSSYRLTFYVKVKPRRGHEEITPTLYADIMRGFPHADKPLSMGYINDKSNYKYNNAFQYTKDLFPEDEWTKVTFMSYYLTDSVAENYFFADGYWWAEDSTWYWAKGYNGNNTQHDLFYIVQPKNFYVRLGFASNYTEFNLDNISLTKSTIGGIDYYQDKLRVNFGYETNLKQLAKAAYNKTKFDAVEIPNRYYEVWGQLDNDQWERVDMATAEYHSDGYMYLFTNGYYNPQTGEFVKYTFDHYRKVLVSFTNPDDEELELKYTGVLFPNALDVEWIKAGKKVFDFYNEEATLNPYVFDNIYSISERAPVMLKAIIESGSFGLDGSIREFKFKFSREMEIDTPAYEYLREKCIVYVGDEIWDRTWSASDSTLILTRPTRYTTPLNGDYVVEINNIYIPYTQCKADDVVIHYNFGAINRDLPMIDYTIPIWDALFYDRDVNSGPPQLQPAGTAALYYNGFSWGENIINESTKFEIGNGYSKNTAARLYFYTDPSTKYPAALSLSPRGKNENHPASLYLGYGEGYEIYLGSGPYVVKFDAASLNKNVTIKLFVYPFDPEPNKIDALDKVQFGEYTFTTNFPESIRNDETSVLDTLMNEMLFGFDIEKPGRYIIEIQCSASSSSSNYPCALLSNIQLYSAPAGFNPIRSLNEAVAAAQARATLASVSDKYAGDALNALNTIVNLYKVDGSFTSTNPSEWYEASNATITATDALKFRMDTVDMVGAKAMEVSDKLASVAADNTNWTQLIDYNLLNNTREAYNYYYFPTHSNIELRAFIKEMDDRIKILDTRIADTKQFNVVMKMANALIDTKEQESFPEYLELMYTYEDYEDFDTLMTTDADLRTALASVSDATYAYRLAVDMFNIGTRRIKELDKLAKDLGSPIPEYQVVKNQFNNLITDDDYLADIYKAAIKVAIYEIICDGGIVDNLDLSPYIKNYFLYATPVVSEEMDVQMPANRDHLKYSKVRHGDANIGHTRHQYQNDMPMWIILTDHQFDNLIPGWTISAGDGSGNDIVSVDSLIAKKDDNKDGVIFKTSNFENGFGVFDGAISMDWGSEVTMATTVIGLPAGEYELGLDVRSRYDYSQKNSTGNGKLKVTIDEQNIETDLITGWFLEETILVPSEYEPGGFEEITNTERCDTSLFASVNFNMPDNTPLMIDAIAKAANGRAQIDNFKLTFNQDPNHDYVAALADARIQLAALLGSGSIDTHTNPQNRDYCIYMDSLSTKPGNQVVIPIKMKNENPITAFSFDINIPLGITFVNAELAGVRDNGHSLSVNNNNGLVSFACLSMDNNVFAGNDGTVINLTVNISNMDGDYNLLINNVELAISATQIYNPEYFIGNVFVEVDHNPGDINRDSIISITDAVGVIQFITNSNVQYLDRHAADANRDKRIDLSDMNLIVDYVIKVPNTSPQLGEGLNGEVTLHTEGLYGIYIDDLTANENSRIVIPIKMKNAASITAYSFDVNLPSGISLVSAELAGTRSNGHRLFSNHISGTNENTVSLACVSLQNNTYSGSDGTIINLTVDIAEDVEGSFDITIDNIEMAVSATQSYNPVPFTGNITVNPVFDPADVNKDGKISIADAVGIVAFIINSDVQGLDRHAADANQDGAIDVTDVVWIINRVIGKSFAPSRRSFNNDISSTIALDYVLNTTSSSLSVNMEGLLNEITAVQFNVTLPNGVNLKKFSTTDSHVYAANRQDDGSYTVVCFSLTNSTFIGGGETVFEVEFDIDDSFQSAPVILNDIKLVTPDCRTKSIDNITFTLSGEGIQTGMFRINDESDSRMYDLQGRQIENTNGIFIRNNKKVMKAK